jgi:hypothetical protein
VPPSGDQVSNTWACREHFIINLNRYRPVATLGYI